ncbi:hypothetical protein SDC9_36565 [bioreactor metagenome]|uniref:Uncharacterized protein n=1 Tax=bioreactor metagenome TaxID=1076179 RepID=A0A644VIT0_9ZZZZ
MTMGSIPDLRVDPSVDDVDDEVEEDGEGADEDGDPHHHRIVAVQCAVDEGLADAAGREIDVDDDRAGDHRHEGGPEIGDHRQERGFQRMAQHDAQARQPLRPRRADVVRGQHLKHRRAHDPRDRGHVGGRERDHRHHPEMRVVEAPAAARQPVQRQGEDQHQNRRHHEIRQHLRADRQAHGEIVDHRVVAHRGDGAERDAHQNRDDEGQEAIGQRHREPLRDDVVHRAVLVNEGGAEIEGADDAPDIGGDLPPQRLVEPVFGVQVRQHLGRQAALLGEGAARRRVHQQEGQDDEQQERRDRDGQTLEDVDDHAEVRWLGAGKGPRTRAAV